jgi:hypothetical protein
MYNVSGIVKDEKGVGIPRVLIRGGKNMIFTDASGNYKVEVDDIAQKITFFKFGFMDETLDLKKYQEKPSENGNLIMKSSATIADSNSEGGEKSNDIAIEEKGLSKKQMKVIGFSLLGVALILTSFLIYKAIKKK